MSYQELQLHSVLSEEIAFSSSISSQDIVASVFSEITALNSNLSVLTELSSVVIDGEV